MAAKEQKAVEHLVRMLSDPTFSNAVFADAVTRQHPTHQQTIMRAMAGVTELWADMWALGHYDARNAGTCEAASVMRNALDRTAITLPYI